MSDIFHDLFVLEMANNHLGKVARGLKIIHDFGRVVRYNGVHAGIKLQIRDIDSFIHKDFRDRANIRYIKKTMDTRLPREAFHAFADAIRVQGCLVMATPFDEPSVGLAGALGCKILKLASSDLNDWGLIEEVAKTRLPVIASVGGSSLTDMDNLVAFFAKRDIPLALNHCVSLYPTPDEDLELNQIDFMRDRYPDITIGFSSHECRDWRTSLLIAYAKGARTFERHVDVLMDEIPISSYCSKPEQIDEWFRAHAKAKAMCGSPGTEKRIPPPEETQYLDALVRGAYAAHALPQGHVLQRGDLYLAIPLQKGQLSCREFLQNEILTNPIEKDAPLTVDHIEVIPSLADSIRHRGL